MVPERAVAPAPRLRPYLVVPLPIDLHRPVRSRAEQTALAEAVRDAAPSESETNYLEWKGTLDLTEKSALAKIAAAVLGFSNRIPDVAAHALGGMRTCSRGPGEGVAGRVGARTHGDHVDVAEPSSPMRVFGAMAMMPGEYRSESELRQEVAKYADVLAEGLPEVLFARSVLHNAGLLRLMIMNATERTFSGVRVELTVPAGIDVVTWKPDVEGQGRLPKAPAAFGSARLSPPPI